MRDSGALERRNKKEAQMLRREMDKLLRSLGGIKDMNALPDALFVIDVGYHKIAIQEAAKLGIPVVGNVIYKATLGRFARALAVMMKAGVPIPVHPSGPNRFPLFHEDDFTRSLDALIELASVPAAIVNWAGSEDTSIEAWCEELARLSAEREVHVVPRPPVPGARP